MAGYNRVVLLGNLTRDPELRYTSGKKAVVDVGMAINDRYKKEDEWVEEVTFVDLTFWGRKAEVANKYLQKGSPVHIEGKLRYESWEKDGQKRSRIKVVVDKLTLLGSKNSQSESDSEEGQPVGAGVQDDNSY